MTVLFCNSIKLDFSVDYVEAVRLFESQAVTALICDSVVFRDIDIPRLFVALSSIEAVTALICDSVVLDF